MNKLILALCFFVAAASAAPSWGHGAGTVVVGPTHAGTVVAGPVSPGAVVTGPGAWGHGGWWGNGLWGHGGWGHGVWGHGAGPVVVAGPSGTISTTGHGHGHWW